MGIDLVTGASGLLGGNLVRALAEQGRRVRVLLRPSARTFHLEGILAVERVTGDITDPASLPSAFAGVDVVYHCAARVTIGRRMTPDLWAANVTGVENVLSAAKQAGVRRVIHCSSVDALGLPEDNRPADETTPWNWDRLGVETAYARSKFEAHQRVLARASAGQDVVVVCPTFMLGAYDPQPSSGRLILAAAKNPVSFALRGGNNFVDVEDVTAAMLAAAQVGRTGGVYILGNANLMYNQIFALIAEALGKHPLRVTLPDSVARLAGHTGDLYESCTGREPALNSALVRLASAHHYYDSSRAVHELGLRQTPITQAIARAVQWFRAVGMLAV